jgi:hypothetical protein
MKLYMNDPACIAAWFRINPRRHAEFLKHCLLSEAWARFWPAIHEARGMVSK